MSLNIKIPIRINVEVKIISGFTIGRKSFPMVEFITRTWYSYDTYFFYPYLDVNGCYRWYLI